MDAPIRTLVHHLLEPAVGVDRLVGEGDAEAIVDGDRVFSRANLVAAMQAIAREIRAAGVERGDRVAILLPKRFSECAAIVATSRADAVFVPINPVLKPAQVRHIVEDSGARLLITSPALFESHAEAFAGLDALQVLRLADDGAIVERPAAAAALDDLPRAQAIGEDLAAILYTSGSTGRPKGVMLSHRNLLAGSRIVRSYLNIGPQDRILSILPLAFDYGLNQFLTALECHATLVPCTFRFGDDIVRALARHRITGLAGVPTIWAVLTSAAPSLLKTPLPQLRYLTNSGGAVPTATVKKLRERLPHVRIFLMYGLTEAFRSTFLPPEEIDRRPGSIGKAIPECEVFPVTASGQRARPGEPGILVHRGPTVSLGYWNRPEDTARVLRPHPFRPATQGGETVCYSGDLVTEDDEGFLYFVARDDAMIKSAGYRISPSEVEEVLMATGSLRQVAVIGLPDPWVGQKVHAVAVRAEGAGPDDATLAASLLKAAAVTLPGHMVPARIEFVAELPTTPNGKVDYKGLVAARSPTA